MNNHFPPAAEKIVADYLDKLGGQLKGMNEKDQQEILAEIRSHIYESFSGDGEGDEIDRALRALKRLGEPGEVVASRVGASVTQLGKKKKSLLYILAGFLIVIFAAPLGMGGLGLVAGLLAFLAGLLVVYFATALFLRAQRFPVRPARAGHHHLPRPFPGDQPLGRRSRVPVRPVPKPSADRRHIHADLLPDAGRPGPTDALVGQAHLARPAPRVQPGAEQDPLAVRPWPQGRGSVRRANGPSPGTHQTPACTLSSQKAAQRRRSCT